MLAVCFFGCLPLLHKYTVSRPVVLAYLT